jgi:hypothetical protein
MWLQRNLSLIGKIAVLKSLAFSKIIYQCGVITSSPKFIEHINDIAFKFLWSNKPDKIKRKTIIADYEQGGLKMLDFKSFVSAQKVMWVRRLCKKGNGSWQAYPYYELNKIMGINSFKCTLNMKKIPHINNFYWTIIQNWNELTQLEIKSMGVFEIRKQYLWLNKHIKINNCEIKWKNWIQKNIFMIHDILDNEGKFLTIEEIERLYELKCDFLQYNSLKDAIPKCWRDKLKTVKVNRNVIQDDENLTMTINKQTLPINLIANRDVYWELIKKIQIPHVTKEKWEQELSIDSRNWAFFFRITRLIKDTKIRTFQYKLIFNLIPCNLYLFRIGKNNSYRCSYCNNIDNITHYFFECEGTRRFWLSFENWWNKMNNETIKIDMLTALFGLKNLKKDSLNGCLQLARWYIHTDKLNLNEPFFYKFLCSLKYKIMIEKTICLRNNNNLNKFNQMWGEIEIHLE